MKNSRKPFLGLIAISAALAMPLAFAQEAVPQDSQDPMQEQVPTTAEEVPAPTTETTAPQALTWADLDTDGDGKLSKEEVASVDALVQAFDTADADSDGLLTPEEYTAFVASSNETAPPSDGGGID